MTAHPTELLLFVGHSRAFDALHEHMSGRAQGVSQATRSPILPILPSLDGN